MSTKSARANCCCSTSNSVSTERNINVTDLTDKELEALAKILAAASCTWGMYCDPDMRNTIMNYLERHRPGAQEAVRCHIKELADAHQKKLNADDEAYEKRRQEAIKNNPDLLIFI